MPFSNQINVLQHNLLDPENTEQTVIETGIAGDVQSQMVYNTTELPLIWYTKIFHTFSSMFLFDKWCCHESRHENLGTILRSLYHISVHAIQTLYSILRVGWMRPATYETEGGTFVQYTAYDKEQVPEGQASTPILSCLGCTNRCFRNNNRCGEFAVYR